MTSEESDKFVIAAVLTREGRYLVCRRPAHKRHGSMWEFPGGKLESGETLFQAALRELNEELNMSVISIGDAILTVRDPGSPYVVLFVPVDAEGEPQLVEHSELRWLLLKELHSLELAPTDRKFVEFMSKSAKSSQDIDGRC